MSTSIAIANIVKRPPAQAFVFLPVESAALGRRVASPRQGGAQVGAEQAGLLGLAKKLVNVVNFLGLGQVPDFAQPEQLQKSLGSDVLAIAA